MTNHQLTPTDGRLTLHTHRQGLAAKIGHDLTLTVTHWSATVATPDGGLPDDLSGVTLDATADLTSLTVTEGTGGAKPLTDKDRKDIVANARKALDTGRYAQATFHATKLTRTPSGGTIDGTLTLHGTDKPLQLTITDQGNNKFQATGQVTQTQHGIKPYSAMLGALAVRDAVDITITVQLPNP